MVMASEIFSIIASQVEQPLNALGWCSKWSFAIRKQFCFWENVLWLHKWSHSTAFVLLFPIWILKQEFLSMLEWKLSAGLGLRLPSMPSMGLCSLLHSWKVCVFRFHAIFSVVLGLRSQSVVSEESTLPVCGSTEAEVSVIIGAVKECLFWIKNAFL